MMEKEYLLKVGQTIKKIRKEKKISQVELANMCNFEKTNMNRIEAGKTNPTLITLIKISKALSINVTDLLYFEKE